MNIDKVVIVLVVLVILTMLGVMAYEDGWFKDGPSYKEFMQVCTEMGSGRNRFTCYMLWKHGWPAR